MNELHVGRGVTRGAMTVFPIWGRTKGYRRYTMGGVNLDVSELENGPVVEKLVVGNVGDYPALVLEGQLFEGGWQHRMARRSVMVGVHQQLTLDVACVEQGRWDGDSRQSSTGRRATPYIRDSVRRGGAIQAEVWNRVAVHTQDVGVPSSSNHRGMSDLHWVRTTAPEGNPTGSFVRRLDDAKAEAHAWSGFTSLTGQLGVLVGVGGQPYIAEVFDSPWRLRRELPKLLVSAALDARLQPEIETPSRRARRFIDRVERVAVDRVEPAGIAESACGTSEHVDLATLRWQGHDVHSRMTNVRHPMLVS